MTERKEIKHFKHPIKHFLNGFLEHLLKPTSCEITHDEFICQDNRDHRCVQLLKANSVDSQRLHVLAVGVALAWAEVGEDLGGEFLAVGVEPGHVVCIVED